LKKREEVVDSSLRCFYRLPNTISSRVLRWRYLFSDEYSSVFFKRKRRWPTQRVRIVLPQEERPDLNYAGVRDQSELEKNIYLNKALYFYSEFASEEKSNFSAFLFERDNFIAFTKQKELYLQWFNEALAEQNSSAPLPDWLIKKRIAEGKPIYTPQPVEEEDDSDVDDDRKKKKKKRRINFRRIRKLIRKKKHYVSQRLIKNTIQNYPFSLSVPLFLEEETQLQEELENPSFTAKTFSKEEEE